jgi:hypothetical protein
VVGKVVKVEKIFFIAVEGETLAVRGGWSAVMVQIQYLSFGSRGEATEQSVIRR